MCGRRDRRKEVREDGYELSPIQQDMLLHYLDDEHSGVDIAQMVVDLYEHLDIAAFGQAWQKVVDRHAVLRTGFRWKGLRDPVQEVWRGVEVRLELHDWRARSAAEQAEKVEAYLRLDRRRGFNLGEAPLMRLVLLQLGETDFRLIWSFHHILLDARSLSIVLEEVFRYYEAICDGETLQLEQPRPYREYIEWIRQLDYSGAAEFWQQKLKGFSVATPLLQDGDAASQAAREEFYGEQEIRLSEMTSTAMRALARRENLTLNTFIQGAWAVLLSRHSGEKDIVLGATETARRSPAKGTQSTLGLFLNTIPVRVRVSDEVPVLTWLKKLRSEWLSLRNYEHTPLVKIKEWTGFPVDAPLFDSLVKFENRRFDSVLRARGGSWQGRKFRLLKGIPHALTLAAYGDSEVLLKIEYDGRRFEPSTITRMLGHLRTLLEGMAANPAQALADLPLLTEAERHQLLVEWNDTRKDYAADSCLHQLFEAQVERSPESVALVHERQKLSYREMNARANQLAHHLRALGVGPDVGVGICMERSLEMVVGLLGILKAGGAYVPLDPIYPSERLAFMLEDSRVPVLLTQQRLLQTLPKHGARLLCLDAEWWAGTGESAGNPASGTAPENLAYVIYTSGSTGRPKGVQLTHRGLCNLVETQVSTCGVRPGDRVLQFCSLSFDPSIFEIGAALSTGATLCVGSQNSLLPGPALFELLRDQAITTIVLPPSVLSPLPDGPLPSLQTLIVGAEPVTSEFVCRWGASRRVFNIYGATETTVFSTIAECRDDGHKPPIGRPIANTRVYLLDSRLRPVPIGVPGELYVGGVGLARGYLNRPELTAERFIPDPFGNEPGARLYRTGDLARYLPDGNIDFLGRVDYQVKVRGHRIELEEVEAMLAEHPAVRESVAVVRDDDGEKRLVAYFVPAQERAPTMSELRSFLRQKVPEYMVPSTFVMLDALPLSPNKKVDRKALPAPDAGRPELEKPYEAPRTKLERLLAPLWQEVLGIEKIGINDSFFELGGDSLRAAVLLSKLQELLGEVVYVVALFDAPTIAGLVTYLNEHYPDAVSRICGTENIHREELKAERINAAKVAKMRQLIGLAAPFEEAKAATPLAKPSAIFILSPPRSGSTLLRVMLAGHAALFAPPELQLMSFKTLGERKAAFSGRDRFWLQGTIRAIMEIKGCNAERAQRIMEDCEEQQLTSREFYLQMQEWIGERRLVDKTTSYALDLEVLRRAEACFEKPLYIHLLRHPYGMIRSFEEAKLDQIFRYEHPFSVRELAELVWLISHQNTLEFLQEVPEERQHRVRFEDLVTQPKAVMKKVCKFLGLDFHPDMLQPYEHKQKRMTDDLHGLPRMLGDINFHRHRDIDASVADRWKENGGEDSLGDITWRVAESLGYSKPTRSSDETEGREYKPIQSVLQDGCAELPLSFAQQRLWFLYQLQPSSPAYNVAQAFRISGAIQAAALQRALEAIVARHASLRTTFVVVGGSPMQVIGPRANVRLSVRDLSESTEGEREAEALRLATQEAEQPFDLARGPLVRASLLRLREKEHLLLLTMHHIVSDAWSIGVLTRELAALYQAFSVRGPSPLPELSTQYADFGHWQRQWLQGEILEGQLSYWKQQLGRAPAALELATDRPRPAVQTFRGATQVFALPVPLSKALKVLGQREGVTLFMMLLAAFQTLLYRYTGQEDVLVGTPIANRTRAEFEGLIGFFVNTLVLRTDLSGDPGFRELLRRVREVALAAYAHQDLPFEKLVEELQPERDLSRNPLFQVMFALQNAPMPTLEFPNLTATVVEVETGTAKFDLTLSIRDCEPGLSGTLEYNTDLFDAETITRMLGHWQTLLEGIVADPAQHLSELPLLTKAERHQVLVEWNDTRADYPRDKCIHQLFEAQVERTPAAVAVICEGAHLTYSELNRRANRLAHHLRKLGVAPEVTVGICMERSNEIVVGMLAVLKAGGAYVPLDPAYPPERLAFMLEDAQVRVLLTEQHLLERIPLRAVRPVCLDADWQSISQERAENLVPTVRPENLAYVVYTSGSTGRPKGALVAHRNLVHSTWARMAYYREPVSSFLLLSSFSFDSSFAGIFWTLSQGGTLVLPRPGLEREPARLAELIAQEQISHLLSLPSLYELLLEQTQPELLLPLRCVIVAGEPCPPELVRRHNNSVPSQASMFNEYGPTEATIWCSVHRCQARAQDRQVSIGRPIANTQIYLLDSRSQVVPVGVAGELHIGGAGLARGYLSRPELTAEKFIPDPFSNDPGARLFKTGDLARYLPDGNIEFLGRIDDQVKLRGFRIELGEIEAVLGQHQKVRESVVIAREDTPGEKRLIAYVVPNQEQSPAVSELRRFLQESLPEYMVPSAFVVLGHLPLTPSGKVDRNALPQPSRTRPELETGYVAPRTPVEKKMVEIWSKTLGLQQVGIYDNFFDLGGHSLLAIQVVFRVREAFQAELPLRNLFESPTIAQISEIVQILCWAAQAVGTQPASIKGAFEEGEL